MVRGSLVIGKWSLVIGNRLLNINERLDLLTLKAVPYWAGYRLPTGKLGGILTHFQTKVNKKILLLRLPARIEQVTVFGHSNLSILILDFSTPGGRLYW